MPYKRFRIYEHELSKFLEDHRDFKTNGGMVYGRLGEEYFFRPHLERQLSEFKIDRLEELSGSGRLQDFFQEGDDNYESLVDELKTMEGRILSLSEQIELGKKHNMKTGALLIYTTPGYREQSVAKRLLDAFRSLTQALTTWDGGFVQISAIYAEPPREMHSCIKIHIEDSADFDALYDHFVTQINTERFGHVYYKTDVSGSQKTSREYEQQWRNQRLRNLYLSETKTKDKLRSKIEELWR